MSSPDNHILFNKIALVVWGILIIPTVTLWRDSILWVSFMSIYAILDTHWTAMIAAKAEKMADEKE